ncbi:hypothetical protein [Paraburkholderia dipogonis]|uniref:hypothetical protein n=1 Tax=Paraburkholderia dipogonis TaxID=1211383 RepID=UPI0038B85124
MHLRPKPITRHTRATIPAILTELTPFDPVQCSEKCGVAALVLVDNRLSVDREKSAQQCQRTADTLATIRPVYSDKLKWLSAG